MNRTDYSRPSGPARWGWVWAAVAFVGGIPNIINTFTEPTAIRVGAAVFTVVVTILCLAMWWSTVRNDAARRAYMRAATYYGDAR